MPLVTELIVLAGFLILGLIGGTLWARRIRHDDSEERRRAESVHALSKEIKQSVNKDLQEAWVEPWEKPQRRTRRR